MSNRVEGKVVVVTGGGQGQGAAEARLLATEGATVVALDLGDAPAEDLAGAEYRRLDVTDAAGWAALAADLHTRHGQVHGLVANAGITWRARLADLAPADLARVCEVNVTGTLLGVQALTPLMPAGGSIVVVGSTAALTAHYPVAYTTSKWALRGLAKAASLELGPHGIRVNTIHPGYIQTPMTASSVPRLPGRQRRRDPARPARHGRRGRPAGAVPAQRRRLVHHRRRDPGRRRDDRSRRREVDQRRRPGGVVTGRLEGKVALITGTAGYRRLVQHSTNERNHLCSSTSPVTTSGIWPWSRPSTAAGSSTRWTERAARCARPPHAATTPGPASSCRSGPDLPTHSSRRPRTRKKPGTTAPPASSMPARPTTSSTPSACRPPTHPNDWPPTAGA